LLLASTTPGGSGLPPASEDLFADEPPAPDWSDRAAVVDYLVAVERPFAGRAFDEAAARELAGRVFDHSPRLATTHGDPYMLDMGEPWRGRLGELTAPALVVHGSEDPLYPLGHAQALAREIPDAELLVVDGMGHEYLPRESWDVVIANLRA
jgi:pimeloyl-ACP methyl ester carboxylesterase